ncbi:MAG: hypothetical protein A7316_07400 [Candidatus Altiarchaeales archaeon WOR_SM1_86-2]|nr:MAG: hypothetical protein A7316_07400 [Candidatus Altiarchaeales archaeon WOR_SM1_86-2]
MALLISNLDLSTITAGEVVVIPLKGEITWSTVSSVGNMLDGALEDESVKAIVLDIDSPGGGVIPSKELMYKVRGSEKPVVARIGESGASGAYYVASAADTIVADEDSITGSIGVTMILFQYYELFDKLGIGVKVITSGERKDIGSPYRNMTEEEEERLQEIIDKIYSHFISDVAENRGMPLSELRELANGDIYLGSEAFENGLVDELGNLNDAIDIAAELGGIEGEPRVRYMQRKPTFYDMFAEGTTNIGYGIGKALLELSEKEGKEIDL